MNELLTSIVGPQRCSELLAQVTVAPQLASSGARYVASQRERGRQVVFDHGAVRTVDWHETGQLPPGAELFRRLLVPLGYEEVGRYPLDGIHMTGRVFTHADLPEQVPQYFVSELHVDRLDPKAQQAVTATVGRVRQTALRADPVVRRFRDASGASHRARGPRVVLRVHHP